MLLGLTKKTSSDSSNKHFVEEVGEREKTSIAEGMGQSSSMKAGRKYSSHTLSYQESKSLALSNALGQSMRFEHCDSFIIRAIV